MSPETSMLSNFELLLQWYRRKMLDDRAPRRSEPIKSLAILGAGLMGVEIAAENLRHGLHVVMTDTNPQTLAAAPERIAAELNKPARFGVPHHSDFTQGDLEKNAVLSSCEQWAIGKEQARAVPVELTADDALLAGCDLILETVVEKFEVKQAVYRRLEPLLNADSMLATNTSTIPIGRLAAQLSRPGRFCGIHFCHPVLVNPLIEIIPGPQTEEATLAAAVEYARLLGKMPIVVEDGPGFLVNRLLLRYTDEAMHLLLDGAGVEQIDRVATEFGMALGPLTIMDEIGLDTSLSAGRVLLDAYPDRVARLPLLPLLVKRKQLGQKTGGGFYRYSGEKSVPNPETLAIVEHYANRRQPPSEEDILQRMLMAMLLEATLILQEKQRLDPREIDLCMICGLGFPSAVGGLLHWADELGPANVLQLAKKYESLGHRFQPTPMLKEMAANNRRFYR